MKVSEELKYLIRRFYREYPDDVEEFKKGYKKASRFLFVVALVCSLFLLAVTLWIHFALTANGIIEVEGLSVIFVEMFFLIFSIIGFLGLCLKPLLRGPYIEGKWFFKEVKASCKLSKIYEDSFIPGKIDTPKKERNPISWKNVDSIDIEVRYNPPTDSDDIGIYNHYLKMNLKNNQGSKLVWIIFTAKDTGAHYLVLLMKKFCEFLIRINRKG